MNAGVAFASAGIWWVLDGKLGWARLTETVPTAKEQRRYLYFETLRTEDPSEEKLLDIFQQVRHLLHVEGFQKQHILLHAAKDHKGLIGDLESANTNVINRSQKNQYDIRS
jgi:hypothetical protein